MKENLKTMKNKGRHSTLLFSTRKLYFVSGDSEKVNYHDPVNKRIHEGFRSLICAIFLLPNLSSSNTFHSK